MFDELDPTVRYAIMSILASVFESGLVEQVDMADVMRLFGVEAPTDVATGFSFADEGWIEAYIDFRESSGVEMVAFVLDDDEGREDVEFKQDPDLDPDRKLH